jgi:hypothetical protein
LHRKINSLDLWLVNASNEEKCLMLARINKNEDSNINCANISNKGNLLAYSDSDNTCLFRYNFQENTLKKVKTFKKISARFLYFSADESRLIIVNQINSKIMIYNINSQTFFDIDFNLDKYDVILACDYFSKINSKEEISNETQNVKEEKTPKKSSSAIKIATSKKDSLLKSEGNSTNPSLVNSEYICFSTVNKNILFFNLDEKNNFVNENMPNPDNMITQIKFRDEKNLILTCEDNKFYLVNYEVFVSLQQKTYEKIVDVNFKFNEWTQRNISNLPINYKKWYNRIMGISVNETLQKNLIIFYTDYNYILVDLDKEVPKYSQIEKIKEERNRNSEWTKSLKDYHKKIFDRNYYNIDKEAGDFNELKDLGKNEKERHGSNDNFKIVSRFSSILYLNLFENPYDNDKSLLIVVENDWNKVTKNFREAVAKPNYAN